MLYGQYSNIGSWGKHQDLYFSIVTYDPTYYSHTPQIYDGDFMWPAIMEVLSSHITPSIFTSSFSIY
jgi:hypothetical protein